MSRQEKLTYALILEQVRAACDSLSDEQFVDLVRDLGRCLYCGRGLRANEICHCTNDE